MLNHNPLGVVVSGSLAEGYRVKLYSHTVLDTIKAGTFVCITSGSCKYFSLVSDISLSVSDPAVSLYPPAPEETVMQSFVTSHLLYATVQIKPMVMINAQGCVVPVKTIPTHFAPVFVASESDIQTIFGSENDPSGKFFSIGTPIGMQTHLCIDLERLVERSSGVFGKTGTGKTFLTRLLLAGLIDKERSATLLFDMHSEYGVQARTESGGTFVKGLKTLFPNKVVIYSLDPEATRRRGCTPDGALTIPYQSIQVDDIAALHEELNLHTTAIEAASLCAARHGSAWLLTLLAQGQRLKEAATDVGAHPESLAALFRKLKRIEQLRFMVDDNSGTNAIHEIVSYLQRGTSVIIEFGNYSSPFCYLLVANLIARTIHARYVQQTERFLATQASADKPYQLIIGIEEAHKFLNPRAARQTIFGTIAREMRKYYVSLLVIDQRPSGIDVEVLSQIGTKIVAQLSDEQDIQAVVGGTLYAAHLRTLISSLDSKKQVALLGHAVPMPVLLQTRDYDETFYASLTKTGKKPASIAALSAELFG